MSRRVVVIGGGITGLSAAFELTRSQDNPEVILLEGSDRLGGKITTERSDGFIFEGGPDSFITIRPDAVRLVKDLGLEDQLMGCDSARSSISVFAAGKLRKFPVGMRLMIPSKFLPFVTTDLLSWRAKLGFLREPFIPPADDGLDESLASFVRRRLGDEVLERIAGPLLAGIYAMDPEEMSLESTFPQFKKMESEGGLILATRRIIPRPKKGGGAPLPLFMTMKKGLAQVPEALEERLGRVIRRGRKVTRIQRRKGRWVIKTERETFEADAVISTLPSPALAPLIEDDDPEVASIFREIPFVSTATVSFVFSAEDFPHPLDGFGFLVARGEGRSVSAATFTSTKFPGRAPAGQVLIRCFLGGAGKEEAAEGDDASVSRAARADLKEILGLGQIHPKTTRVRRWIKANPQYTVGHALRLRRIESCLKDHPGLFVAGCSYRGVGLADCIRSGREAARRALAPAGGESQSAVC